MPYSPTTWVSGSAPGISAANLNNIENGIKLVDSGVFFSGGMLFTDLPSAQTAQMMSMGNGQTGTWPFTATVLTLHGSGASRLYMHQLYMGTTEDKLYWRKGVDSAGTAWTTAAKIMHSRMDEDITFSNASLFKLGWSSAVAGKRITLDAGQSHGIGWNMFGGGQDTTLFANTVVSFMKDGWFSYAVNVDFSYDSGPPTSGGVITWGGYVGRKEIYDRAQPTAFVRGLTNNALYDKTSQFYRMYNGADTPGTTPPAFEVDTVNDVATLGGSSIAKVASGQYTGTDALNRVILCGFTPRQVTITNIAGTMEMYVLTGLAPADYGLPGGVPQVGVSPSSTWPLAVGWIIEGAPATFLPRNTMTFPSGSAAWIAIFIVAGGFKVGGVTGTGTNTVAGGKYANVNGTLYNWVAIG